MFEPHNCHFKFHSFHQLRATSSLRFKQTSELTLEAPKLENDQTHCFSMFDHFVELALKGLRFVLMHVCEKEKTHS